jgi:hypothetical protein
MTDILRHQCDICSSIGNIPAKGQFIIDFWSELKEILPSSLAIRPSEAGRRPAHEFAAPNVTQRLGAIRHLFDRLATGQVVPVNPAAFARGPPARGRVRGEGGTDLGIRPAK